MTGKVQSNPSNSKDYKKEQTSSDEPTAEEKRTEKNQDKNPGRQQEVVERESPETHTDQDPRVN